MVTNMVEFAAILPTQLLRHVSQKYHLVLVQELHRDKRYASYYRTVAARGEFVILDNGAYETGSSTAFSNLVAWAHHLKAAEVVLPDVLYDANGTLQKTGEAFSELQTRPLPPGTRVMVVPQGGNYREWAWCCERITNLCLQHDVSQFTIGIPKHTCTWRDGGLGRIPLIDFVQKYDRPVHLLGTDDQLQEMTVLRTKTVRSIDSAKPIIYALNGHTLRRDGLPPTEEVIHRPKEYFATVSTPDTIKVALLNIARVRYALSSRKDPEEVA